MSEESASKYVNKVDDLTQGPKMNKYVNKVDDLTQGPKMNKDPMCG